MSIVQIVGVAMWIPPLHMAANNGHLEVCRAIMEKVENKNPVDNNGQTPKEIAESRGHLMVVQLFT